MREFAADTKVRFAPDAVSRVIGGEALIVDLRSGLYFGLDPVGSRIWELISEKGTFGAILDGVVAGYDVTRDVARADLVRLLGDLEASGLVEVGGADGAG